MADETKEIETPATSIPDQGAAESEHGILATTAVVVRDLFLAVVLAGIVILFVYQPVKVEGTSMMPALEDQERIFINKFVYKLSGGIERGDMVVFLFPHDTTKNYIKRVVGLPGDRIRIVEGAVYVNGAALHEPYVPDEFRDHITMEEREVPADRFFVMGDHRSSSNDSRNWGTVPRNFIYGKAVFAYWPLDKAGAVR